MPLKDLKIRIGLASIRRVLASGDFPKGYQEAVTLSQKFQSDERVLILLADACLFLRKIPEAKLTYEQVLSLLEASTSIPMDSKRFLRAYISYRLLEVDFLQDNQKGVAKSQVVEDINNIPSGSSMKSLFFLDANYPKIPRPYASRNAARKLA